VAGYAYFNETHANGFYLADSLKARGVFLGPLAQGIQTHPAAYQQAFIKTKIEQDKFVLLNSSSKNAASREMMSDLLSGKTQPEAKTLTDMFIAVMQGQSSEAVLSDYGDLVSLAGVVRFPLRVKCATLAWHALQEQLDELT